MEKYLYAAYGSNTDVQQFKFRCPHAQLIGRGVIEDYTLSFQGRANNAYCNILKSSSKEKKFFVPVAIWQITDIDLPRLDRYEGYPTVYNRVEIPVKVSDNEYVKCMVYVMTKSKEVPYNLPSLDYLYTVMRGYKINGLNPKFLYEALATAVKKSNK
ncbi:MAG: gamma-glutamylcyclotransferase [Eubacterium sp.]|nr:gamma-glutamylcyclotransferase [Eubacterium sp.]